jgi:hypothetical protein
MFNNVITEYKKTRQVSGHVGGKSSCQETIKNLKYQDINQLKKEQLLRKPESD